VTPLFEVAWAVENRMFWWWGGLIFGCNNCVNRIPGAGPLSNECVPMVRWYVVGRGEVMEGGELATRKGNAVRGPTT
jgi:hypothetical protein